MKKKTYNNFMTIMSKLQKEKHYNKEESEHLARLIFDNVESDIGYGNKSAEFFYSKILTKEEFEQEKRSI